MPQDQVLNASHLSPQATAPKTRRRRRVLRLLALLVAVPLAGLALFVLNGLVFAARNDVVLREDPNEGSATLHAGDEVVVLAYNIAKAFVHEGGFRFKSAAEIEARVARLEEVVRTARPDLVFLSESIWDCGPCPVDQVARLADAGRLRYRALGENYNLGVPGYRIAGGNAILSRYPLRPVANFDLAGRKPFWVTSNNRRALFCALDVAGGASVLLGAMHPDSFSRKNNAVHISQIMQWIDGRPALLAGDFNSRPHEGGMQEIRKSGRFVGEFEGAGTLTAVQPPDRIDFVLAPAAWEHLSTQVVDVDASDHRPVVAKFRVR